MSALALVAADGTVGVLQSALVYLAAAVVIVPIATRLKLGSVLGYLVAGIAIGPAVLDLVGDAQEVMHFAEFGVVMMLFLIGLELRPSAFWSMRKDVVGLGGLQVLVTTGAVFGIAVALGVDARAALAIGFVLSLSSTAIVLQTLSEKGLGNSRLGRRAFSVLLFQDLAVIPILAILPLLAPAQDDAAALSYGQGSSRWLQALAVLAAILGIVVFGKLLVRPLLRAVAATHLRELFAAAALLLVVAISYLMGLVGLSAALGTFLAGVVLADSEYRHELESDLEPFKGLLLGLFFITVGASIDFGLVVSEPWTVIGLVVGLMVLKAVVLLVLGKLWGVRPSNRATLALMLAQAGEFGFVLVATSRTLAIFDPTTAQLLIATIAISMALTPLLLLVDDRLVQPQLLKRANRDAVGGPPGNDEMPERPAPILIAGFGRFGQVVGRLLMANGFEITVLDLDPDRIAVLRQHGLPVYFGDASRADLLESAACEDARVLVIATGDPVRTRRIAEAARKLNRNMKIIARAYDVRHAHLLLGIGVDETVCAVRGGGLKLGRVTLRHLGFHPYRAQRAVRRFDRHEDETQRLLFEVLGDPARTLEISRSRTADLEKLLEADRGDEALTQDAAWSITREAAKARN